MPEPYVLQDKDVGGTCKDGLEPNPKPTGAPMPSEGGRRGSVKAKTLRRMLKKAGLKVSGKKSTLRARAKKAHLVRGGDASASAPPSTAAAYPFAAGMAGGNYEAAANAATYAGQLGGRRRGIKAKTLKKLLKRAGLKVSGKKSTLRARAKKAHLVRGGA